ncbi:hypothetical protein CF68_32985 [Cupriavidus sp. SK-4]|uniref:hypothetical protein n=1 Tax=Cupriavidus sp. SK-4 TaxID=574750 RepID=UPI000448D95C|nr:hypothetical protein [Cupriavidus sp. SK-4]EYS89519.1 hypothetical protein CF68_32985 [Cupriavidus sp. SK-4]
MDGRWSPVDKDALRTVALIFHPTASIRDVRTGAATDAIDLSAYVSETLRQSPRELSASLTWHLELYGASQPKAGQIIELKLDGQILWLGIIESVNDYRIERGTRRLTLTARSPDATPAWRGVRRVTDFFPVATPLTEIARQIGRALGLNDDEIILPPSPVTTMHSNTQLADLTAWDMLEQLLLPLGLAPRFDGLGRLTTQSRELGRATDIVLDDARIVSVSGGRSVPALSSLRLKWLDPQLTKVAQQDAKLADATITAGFFQLHQRKSITFSDDATQRAENTRLVVKQSANGGLLPVCDEEYKQLTTTSGEILLTTVAWAPTLVGLILAMKVYSALPDIAPPFGGPTAPTGKIVHGAAELVVLLIMASIGTGIYEVWGTPYDFVHGRNTTEAKNSAASIWTENVEDIENDLIVNEAHAQTVAVRELVYRARSATSWGASIVDDLRIEPGDILQFPDGTRFCVTDYTRNLARNAPAVLELQGFVA